MAGERGAVGRFASRGENTDLERTPTCDNLARPPSCPSFASRQCGTHPAQCAEASPLGLPCSGGAGRISLSTSARSACSVWRAPVCRVWGVGFAAQAGGIAPGITRPRRARARGRFLVRTGPLPARAAPPRSVARRRARRLAGRWERGMGDPAAARTEGRRTGTRGIGVGAGREHARPLLAAGRTRHALIPHAPHARRARKCCRSRCPACFSASWRCWRSARRVPFRLPP